LRSTEYWIKKADIWKKESIEHLGEPIPIDAVLLDKLSKTQRQEIAEQTEMERVANLTTKQKIEEKEAALNAAKREVRYMKDEANIADEPFDAKTEYQLRKTKIEQKYA
jgi:hypothetical protein